MAKKLTPEDRALRLARSYGFDRSTPTGNAYMNGHLAGWHARGRADRLTKAERAVVEAAAAFVRREANSAPDLDRAVINLERARRKA